MQSSVMPIELNIQLKRQHDGMFFVSSEQIKRAETLKHLLFAWHEPSFYGTAIEVKELGRVNGILLPPNLTLSFLAHPFAIKHLRLHWEGEAKLLRAAAELISEALEQRWFVPDYYRWIQGELAWRLDFPSEKLEAWERLKSDSEDEFSRDLNLWFNDIVEERATEDAEFKQLQDQLLRSAPPQWGTSNASIRMDEEEWLVRLGWRTDATPFRIGLKLLEPAEGSTVWTLSVLFQDKAEPELNYEFGTEQPEAEDLPLAWQPYAADKWLAETRRWLEIVPQLSSGSLDDTIQGIKQELTEQEAWTFLSQWSIELAQFGCLIILPNWWEKARTVKPKLKGSMRHPSHKAEPSEAGVGLQQMLEFDWSIAVGDLELTEEEFRQITQHGRRLIRRGSDWVQLHPDVLKDIQKALRRIQKKGGLTLQEVLYQRLLQEDADFERAELADTVQDQEAFSTDIELSSFFEQMMHSLQEVKRVPLQPVPASFQGALRPYQQEGMSWLLFLRQFGLGGCLADDMGLGKTIQWITYLLHVKREQPSLLVCPTSVLGNWQKEFERFAPELKVYLHYGQQRKKGGAFLQAIESYDVVLTSYPLSHLDEKELGSVVWDAICLDEAQQIKNSYTKQSLAIRALPARHKVALTGTPIENRLQELWTIFDFINPGYLGSQKQFQQQFIRPIEKQRDQGKIHQVQQLVKPFLLRREKKDPAIRLNLPQKRESKCYVSLTPWQGVLYEQVLENLFHKVDDLTMMERKGLILASITKLKQICDHPQLFLKSQASATVEETIQASHKMSRLVEMITELRESGERCLVFTQYIDMGHLLQQVLQEKLGEPTLFMHGGIPKSKRDEMIASFQHPDADFGVFLLSLKTGGTGLNLTAANHVFHVDRWWNPAVENQATDRAYRMGQTKEVEVHKFVTLGTLEEKIDEMLERKQGLSQQIIGTGENWITELSSEELREVLAFRQKWMG